MTQHTLCLTLGDCNGLGPELVCRHFAVPAAAPLEDGARSDQPGRVVLIGLERSLTHHLRHLGARSFYTRIVDPAEICSVPPGIYLYEPPELADIALEPGQPTPDGGRCAGISLEWAVSMLRAGQAHGLLTCPLNKAMLHAGGFDFPGHTEFLAERLGVGRDGVCMHLGGPKLRVSLVTTHPRLRDVPDLITTERVLLCLRLTWRLMQSLGQDEPIAVCGLNPHAGESGRIGEKEIAVIGPAVLAARAEGIPVAGPLPGDTTFHFAAKGCYSAVLAMYHDQGLAPLKLLHFSEAVNVTLGLPYPRTSPDHGTGYDLVGTGRACLDSFEAALAMVRRMMG